MIKKIKDAFRHRVNLIKRDYAIWSISRDYDDLVKQADAIMKGTGKVIYITDMPGDESKTIMLTAADFLQIMHDNGTQKTDKRLIQELRGSCWYHTSTPKGKEPMSNFHKRRIAYIRDRVYQKGLLFVKKDFLSGGIEK